MSDCSRPHGLQPTRLLRPWGYSLVAVCGFLFVVASLVAEHGLWGLWGSVVGVHSLSTCSSLALEHRLNSCGAWVSCSAAWGIFPDQGLNPCLLHWQADFLPLSLPGSPMLEFLNLFLLIYLVKPYGMGEFSSLTRGQACAPFSRSTDS